MSTQATQQAGGDRMDFIAVVDQAITLLRQRGRVTYRTLQQQFQLDDDTLHDLKEALLYAHPEVRDDAGRGVVWTGTPPRRRCLSLRSLARCPDRLPPWTVCRPSPSTMACPPR
jgi:hypothetical protein